MMGMKNQWMGFLHKHQRKIIQSHFFFNSAIIYQPSIACSKFYPVTVPLLTVHSSSWFCKKNHHISATINSFNGFLTYHGFHQGELPFTRTFTYYVLFNGIFLLLCLWKILLQLCTLLLLLLCFSYFHGYCFRCSFFANSFATSFAINDNISNNFIFCKVVSGSLRCIQPLYVPNYCPSIWQFLQSPYFEYGMAAS